MTDMKDISLKEYIEAKQKYNHAKKLIHSFYLQEHCRHVNVNKYYLPIELVSKEFGVDRKLINILHICNVNELIDLVNLKRETINKFRGIGEKQMNVIDNIRKIYEKVCQREGGLHSYGKSNP